MKKLIAILLMACTSFFVFSERNGKTYHSGVTEGEALVTDNHINVRSRANMKGAKLFQLNAGELVDVLEILDDEMFAEGYYAQWVKIGTQEGTGYVLSRWLTSHFVQLNDDIPAESVNSEWLAYEWFTHYSENYDPYSDSEIDDEVKVVEDTFIHIKKGKPIIVQGFTWVPEPPSSFWILPKMSVEKDLGLKQKNILRIYERSKYPGGSGGEVGFYAWDGDDRLVELVKESGYWEGGYSRTPYINFTAAGWCYDLRNNKWIPLKTKKKNIGGIIVTVEKVETVRDDNGNYKEVTETQEYEPGK